LQGLKPDFEHHKSTSTTTVNTTKIARALVAATKTTEGRMPQAICFEQIFLYLQQVAAAAEQQQHTVLLAIGRIVGGESGDSQARSIRTPTFVKVVQKLYFSMDMMSV
jgi:hypothetical protein